MQRYAIVKTGSVVNVVVAASLADVHTADGETAVAHATAGIGWQSSGGVLSPPAAAPVTTAGLVAHANLAAAARLATPEPRNAAGVVVLADATQGTIADLLALQQWGAANPTATVGWVASDNTVTEITGAQAVALAGVVGPYRLGVFAVLGQVLSAIAAGAITTTAQIDAAAWPPA